jgi:hypothetical protein
VVRPRLRQQAAQLGERARLLDGQGPAGGGDRGQVRPGELPAEAGPSGKRQVTAPAVEAEIPQPLADTSSE